MPKKRITQQQTTLHRQRQAARDKAREQRRFLADAARRDAHARLVAERHGDPRYVQRGDVLSLPPELVAVTSVLQQRFRQRFGRDPGPGDTLFFDPDSDTPVPRNAGASAEEVDWDVVIEIAIENGSDPALLRTWRDLGYIVTEANRHVFSAAEVQDHDEFVRAYRGLIPDDDDGLDDDSDGELTMEEVYAIVSDRLEPVVARMLRDLSTAPIENLLDGIDQPGLDEEVGGLLTSAMLTVLISWLRSVIAEDLDSSRVMAWVEANWPLEVSAAALQTARLIDFAPAPRLLIREMLQNLGPLFLPALAVLATGIVATAGRGDTRWLRQFDVDPDPEDEYGYYGRDEDDW